MPQAKTLSDKELKIVLAVVAQGRHAVRDRAMLLMSFWSGMRVGEIAALRIGDVINPDGAIKDEVRLTADQTKGHKGRTVLLGDRLRRELSVYVESLKYLEGVSGFLCVRRRETFPRCRRPLVYQAGGERRGGKVGVHITRRPL